MCAEQADHADDPLAAAMREFDTACREVAEQIAATDRFRDSEANRSLAYLSLAEARAMAYNLAIAPRLDHPRVIGQSSWYSLLYSLGGTCQDFRYGAMLLDGRQTYRVSGSVGQLKLMLFQVQNSIMGAPGHKELSNTDLLDLARSDGTFEVILSAEPHDGPWIALDPGSGLNFVIVRRILATVADDPGRLRVERLGGPEPAPHTDPRVMAERLHRAADLLRYLVQQWAIGLYDMYIKAAGGVNRLAHIHGQELADGVLGSSSTTYGLGIFELEPEEALVLEWKVPQTAYWSVQLQDVWSNPFDFFNYQADLGISDATLDDDGVFRAVISAEDPGVRNWLDTRGHRDGAIIMRNYRARTVTDDPVVEKVRFADLAGRLPAGTARVTPDERATALARRREVYLTAFET